MHQFAENGLKASTYFLRFIFRKLANNISQIFFSLIDNTYYLVLPIFKTLCYNSRQDMKEIYIFLYIVHLHCITSCSRTHSKKLPTFDREKKRRKLKQGFSINVFTPDTYEVVSITTSAFISRHSSYLLHIHSLFITAAQIIPAHWHYSRLPNKS